MTEIKFGLDFLTDQFIRHYGGSKEDISIFFAPGRVNLIGEHTDYNGGYVFPCSLHFGTYLFARIQDRPAIKLKSLNMPMVSEICLNKAITSVGQTWMNYPLGVIREFQMRNLQIPGLELMFAGNVPNAAGLSSSASIEMATAIAINDFCGNKLDRLQLIRLSQHAENKFVGMNCGIMDQFAVGLGRKDHALLLNCDTLDYKLVPLKLGDHKLVITNTNKRRELAGSKYNERRSECERAVNDINIYKPIKNLSEISSADFNYYEAKINNDVDRRRAKHVIFENDRVLKAYNCLNNDDLASFGQLMIESHYSLKEDYEVSCFELDTLVELALKQEGVLGSRMTGAGFGGCTVSLVHKECINIFNREVGNKYERVTNLTADFFVAETGDGAAKLY